MPAGFDRRPARKARRPPRIEMEARAKDVLAFIRRFQAEQGYPPTFREIVRGSGQRSYAAVQRQLKYLVAAGWLAERRSRRQLYSLLKGGVPAP